jgi:hypothetical protein
MMPQRSGEADREHFRMTLLLREHEESVPAGSEVSTRKGKRRNEREKEK